MTRYFTKSQCETDDTWITYCDPIHTPSITVHDSEGARFSGLYSMDGEPLYASDRAPLGFLK